ncbi:MAG: hypothetical protein WD470_04955 [Rhodospirillaceae bacterium]
MGLSLSVTAASAQLMCGDRTDMAKRLAAEYQEVPEGMGLTNSGEMLEVYTSRAGTWTITLTLPATDADGKLQSCLIAHGDDWESLPPQLMSRLGDLS